MVHYYWQRFLTWILNIEQPESVIFAMKVEKNLIPQGHEKISYRVQTTSVYSVWERNEDMRPDTSLGQTRAWKFLPNLQLKEERREDTGFQKLII